MLDVDAVMHTLAVGRPLFHSEADFQFAFAWAVREQYANIVLRLEQPVSVRGRRIHVDLIASSGKDTLAIELKYKTRPLTVDGGTESFALTDHPSDIARCSFLKDVERLEAFVNGDGERAGYAILLTNNASLWTASLDSGCIDHDFHVHDGRVVRGELKWKPNAAAGSTRGYKDGVTLSREHNLGWRDYSVVETERTIRNRPRKVRIAFRYLAVAIPRLAALSPDCFIDD